MRTTWIGAAALALVFGAGCASTPVPADRLAKAQASLTSAQGLGADRVPGAALHYKVANDELAQGRRLIQDGENDRASRVLGRSMADAEAAKSLANEANVRADAQKSLDELQRLKSTPRPEAQ